jgi:mutator protein MutT
VSTAERRAPVHVVAGVLNDSHGRVLLAQRPTGKHLAGGWEFPGGKIKAGESRIVGLARELLEELGVVLQAAHPLVRLIHAYPDRRIDLDVWVITRFQGEPRSLDRQRLRWCERDALLHAELLPADLPVVTALLLPERIVASTGPGYRIVAKGAKVPRRKQTGLVGTFCDGQSDAIEAAAAGVDFIVLRESLETAQMTALCAVINVPVYAHGIGLPEAWTMGASGVSELAG